MSITYLPIRVAIQGVEDVNRGFKEISDNAKEVGDSFKATAMDLMLLTMAARGIVHLSEAFGMLNEEQAKSLSLAFEMVSVFAAVLRVIQLLSTAEWALTAAKKARAIASGIAMSVESLGILSPVIAAAAIAGAVAVTAAFAAMPARELGGPIYETGPYFLHKDEYVLSPEQTRGLFAAPPTATNIYYIDINYPVFRTRSDMDLLVDRLKRLGKA